jgi:pimeloyl-ACP methyl ester carboxylesterase
MHGFAAGLDGVTFSSHGSRLLGGFYKASGKTPRPTAVLIHGLPGIEKNLDLAYALRDLGWNCLYFHFRGCWGSHGAYSLAGLTDDTRAAVDWVRQQPSVDKDRIVLLGASTGSYPAFLYAADQPHVRAIVGISPVIEPKAFKFPPPMAEEFSLMLNGVTGPELVRQWESLEPMMNAIDAFAPRPVLLVTAGNDPIFPAAAYRDTIADIPGIKWLEHKESDHGFSAHRPWLVQSVTDWLSAKIGREQ